MFLNWKTTLFGALTLAASVASVFVPPLTPVAIALASGIGFAAKDLNVTGGTKKQ